MTTPKGLLLTFSTGEEPTSCLEEIGDTLARVGAAVWPLDLSGSPQEIKSLLDQESLTTNESQRVLDHFLLSRERLLNVIKAARREPNLFGGGELSTYVTNHDYWYPQMWIAQAGEDYSRFDRLHVNTADDGTGVDEVLQMVAGAGIKIILQQPDQSLVTLELECPDIDSGWTVTYNGGSPHIGSVSSARPGTKLVTQVIGPASWQMRYV